MQELWDEIRRLHADRKALRSFGRTVGLVLLGIALFIVWRAGWTPTSAALWLGGIGFLLLALGLLLPAWLSHPYRIWMGLALVLGFVMSHVVLSLVYFLVVTPIGLIFRLRGKDLLDRRLEPDARSYWKRKVYLNPSRERFEKYY